MTIDPLFEESASAATSQMLQQFAGADGATSSALEELAQERASSQRKLAIYPAAAGFELVDELDHLATRTIESNIFFNPRFLAPAMPRLEDRDIRLAVIRDDDEVRSRLRLLVPYSVEHPLLRIGPPFLRTWANPFGPLGTPLVDRDDPSGVVGDFLSMMARPTLGLPKVFVFPDMRMDGPVSAVLQVVAAERNLPLVITHRRDRPILASEMDGEDYLRNALSSHHMRGYRRLDRRLRDQGEIVHHVAETAEENHVAVEHFLALEASGWKGKAGSAMAVDRFRAAFLREAVDGLAQRAMCRIHTMTLDGRPIASLIVFLEGGVAYTWKTAFDENLSAYSPGVLLMLAVTRLHLEDPYIQSTDSCAVPDHPVMSRIWTERAPLGTVIVGLDPSSDRAVHQTAAGLDREVKARSVARHVRNRLRTILRRR